MLGGASDGGRGSNRAAGHLHHIIRALHCYGRLLALERDPPGRQTSRGTGSEERLKGSAAGRFE